MLNRLQSQAKTPIMVTVDGEWGLGMRFTGVKNFPFQLTLGAVPDAELVYKVGGAIGRQFQRMHIHVNYAPVVDINNNPNNPVIGVRSFGEDKYKVALMGTRIMEGMQDNGIMACAKHFPGHGDVAVDSHFDLPFINKNRNQLDSLELYPFKQLFSKGVGSVMVAHLFIPAIDSTPNRATSLSPNNIIKLMRNELGYNGLTFTDGLEMKGVTKYFPDGEVDVQSLIAGNDMLCLPTDIPQAIEKIKVAIDSGRLSWDEVNDKCKRVLLAKYKYVVGKIGLADTANLVADLNYEIPSLRKEVAENALTVIKLQDGILPLKKYVKKRVHESKDSTLHGDTTLNRILYVAIGGNANNQLSYRLKDAFNAKTIALPFNDSDALASFKLSNLKGYDKVIIGLHGIALYPARNFGVPARAIQLINKIQAANENAVLLTFGNPYINKNFSGSRNLIACYEDDSVFQNAAADWLSGNFDAVGTLPVTVGDFKFGRGIFKKKNP